MIHAHAQSKVNTGWLVTIHKEICPPCEIIPFLLCCSCSCYDLQRPDAPDRDRFDQFVKRLANMGSVDGDRVSATQLPARSLYEYCFDTQEGVWKAWRTQVQEYEPPRDGQFCKILVPTVDVVR